MTTQLVLHIGANKTGSSAIQRFLQKNSAQLRKHGFLVPDHKLGWSKHVTGEQIFTLQDLLDNRRSEIAGIIRQLLDKKPAEGSVVVSGENLANPGNHKGFEEVCRNHPTTIILYIRRQDELLTSAYQQWGSKVEPDINAALILALRRNGHWERVINDWESVAGSGNVKVRLFQRNLFPNGNICHDFLDAIGKHDQHELFDSDIPDPNPSFPNYLLPLVSGSKAIFNGVHDNEFYRILQELTGDHYTKDTRFSLISRKQRDNIVAFYEAENRRICKKFFPERAELFDPVDHSKYVYLTKDEMVDLQLRFLTHMVFVLAQRK